MTHPAWTPDTIVHTREAFEMAPSLSFREPTPQERSNKEVSKYVALAEYLSSHDDAFVVGDGLHGSGITQGLRTLGVEVATSVRREGFYVKVKSRTNHNPRVKNGINYDTLAVELRHQGWAVVKCDTASKNLVAINGAMKTRGMKVTIRRREDGFMVKLLNPIN